MMISVAALSGYARVRRITISLPLAAGALFEPPMRGTGWLRLCFANERERANRVLGTGTSGCANHMSDMPTREHDRSSATVNHSDFCAI